jgi:hypothetical protein
MRETTTVRNAPVHTVLMSTYLMFRNENITAHLSAHVESTTNLSH